MGLPWATGRWQSEKSTDDASCKLLTILIDASVPKDCVESRRSLLCSPSSMDSMDRVRFLLGWFAISRRRMGGL